MPWLAIALLAICCPARPCRAQIEENAPVTPEEQERNALALKPAPVILSPGPQYAGSARIFQGIPGIERALNGRLWAVWYGGGPGEGPDNYCMLVTSADDGATWSDLKLVIDPPGNIRAFDPCLWMDPDGRLWLFYAQGYSLWDGRAGVWAIVTEQPGDENPEWSAPRRLCDGIMMNKPTVLTSGAWLLPAAIWAFDPIIIDEAYAHDIAGTTGSWVVASTDRGATWTPLGRSDVDERQCDEHMVVERQDGSLWMLVRTKYGIGESVSTDGGKTWGPGRRTNLPHFEAAARFFIRRLSSGKLLLVCHHPPSGNARSYLTAFLSGDDGKTWQGGLLLDERKYVSYPDGVQSPDGTIYIIYDFERHGAKQILMATFTEEDVAAGKCVSDRARLRVLVNQATGVKRLDMSKVTLKDNADGAPLLTAASPDIEPADGELDTFRQGAKLFLNRAYTVRDKVEGFDGLRFVRASIDHAEVVCRSAGVVFVLTPLPDRNKDSVIEELLGQGFEKAAVSESLLFGEIEGNICSIFQKRVEAGETVRFGKWGVLLY
ncbi:MAG: exo-alpha-sialidase [Candidatus Hydrogenedentes bacterium]|nr:exo-alpha-sialidase [Candidatus Hydrogenedentota bacterium]